MGTNPETTLQGYRVQPALEVSSSATFDLGGTPARLLDGIIRQWVLPAPFSNPDLLEMFRDPDRRPLRNREPWAGEFAGKYLTHAAQIHRLVPSAALRRHLEWFMKELISLQAEDGYLGPWPKECRLANRAPNSSRRNGLTWDTWGHYHLMLGLLFWHRETGNPEALACCRRIGDLLCLRFRETGEPMAATGGPEMNLAPIHALCLLYRATGNPDYLDLAYRIEKEFEAPLAGDYVRATLAGKEFYQLATPRWESLHPIQGLVELYFISGDEKYRRACEQIWWSILKTDRHNNGGFSSGEKAQGNPYHEGAIETCCTVAWVAFSVDLLRLTGNSIVADEIELSTLNSGIGMASPSGRWVTYNTPMDGVKIASPNDATAFQARPGQAELNCCSVNGPRIPGMLSEWAIMEQEDGLALNYYGPGVIRAALPSGTRVAFVQETDYPRQHHVRLRVQPEREESFALSLRIPYWSHATTVRINGKPVAGVLSGQYLRLERRWAMDERVDIEFDFRLHFWVRDERGTQAQERERLWLTSIYRGPILLAYDPRFSELDEVPALRAAELSGRLVEPEGWLKPWLLLEFPLQDGRALRLCDFGSAGTAGHAYRTWLPVRFPSLPGAVFSRENPLRSFRI